MRTRQYEIQITENAMNLLAMIKTLSIKSKEERKNEIEKEIESYETMKTQGFKSWYCENKDFIEDAVINKNFFFESLNQLKKLKKQRNNPPPQRLEYGYLTEFVELENCYGTSGFSRKQTQYYLQKYLYGLVGVVYFSFGGSIDDPKG
jgi:hypothetical protein